MTNDEAIKLLMSMKDGIIHVFDGDRMVALEKAIEALQNSQSQMPGTSEDVVSRNAIIQKLNTMDRYVSEELRLCDTEKRFPKNEVFIVDDVYEEIVESLPSAQPEVAKDTNVPYKDTISRHAAIDILDAYQVMVENGEEKPYTWARLRMSELPSAQPEPSTEIQEILDYLDTTLHPIVSPDNWYVYSELHDMVSMLPSAQSEIIRCKDCKYYSPMNRETKTGICSLTMHQDFGDDWFCAGAERRTDETD